MKEKFEGDRHQNLLDALKRQELVAGDADLANEIVAQGELLEFQRGDLIITEAAEDDAVYFLISGSVAVVVKRNEVATRSAGQHIGEMSAIEPAQKRSATNVAHDCVVALKLEGTAFLAIARTYPKVWEPIARELSRRLLQRNALIQQPNEYPKLFIISSAEALDVAREVQSQLERDVFSALWTDGCFFAGGYSLEALENAVGESDFAVAIAQPDDVVESRNQRQATLRDNVLFELGLFMGKLTRHRAFLIHPRVDNLKLPSDLHGLTLLSYAPCKPDELRVRLGPACNEIRKIVKNLGVRTHSGSPVVKALTA